MDCPDLPFEPLAAAIVRQLHCCPDRCALRFRGTSITNAALLQRILALSAQLGAAGVTRGMRVGVCLERGPDIAAVLLALWWSAAVYVPLDPALPRERLFTMCEIAGIDLLITQPVLATRMERLPCLLFILESQLHEPQAPLPAAIPRREYPSAPGDPAYILFTSGSTGIPKGVEISQGNLAALFAAIVPLLNLTQACRVLCCTNTSFDIAFFELLAPLLCGGTLIMADQDTCAAPHLLLQLLEQEGATVVQATPSHWQLLNALEWTRPIDMAIATGEALPRDTAADILRNANALWNLYGPTECTLWSSAHLVTANDLLDTAPALVSIGKALPGYTLQLEQTHANDAQQAGELLIAGAGVGLGYCGSAVDACSFQTNGTTRAYRSGDMCRFAANGLLHYLGRRDNQVKHNGYRIELDEIGLMLRQHMSIRDAVCCVRPATAGAASLLFAYVTFRPGMPNRDKAALNGFLATYLPAWMLPQRYFFVERLPMTANGKLDRAALLALSAPTCAAEPRGNLEAEVARVFCEVLDIDSIGPYDSFMDAGGSSMLAATLVLTLNERLGSQLTLRQALATPPTVNGIVQLLGGASVASQTI